MGLELTTPGSRVTCSTDWTSQVPRYLLKNTAHHPFFATVGRRHSTFCLCECGQHLFWINTISIKWLGYYLCSKPENDKTMPRVLGARVTPNSLESVNYLLCVVNCRRNTNQTGNQTWVGGSQGSLRCWATIFCHVLAKGLLCLEEYFLEVWSKMTISVGVKTKIWEERKPRRLWVKVCHLYMAKIELL